VLFRSGCLCKGKSAGRPRVSEESVERVKQYFLRSPKKSHLCRHVSQTCRVTFSFLLVFISLFTILVNIINFQTAPIILIHLVHSSTYIHTCIHTYIVRNCMLIRFDNTKSILLNYRRILGCLCISPQ
jgi:hypothetical protein